MDPTEFEDLRFDYLPLDKQIKLMHHLALLETIKKTRNNEKGEACLKFENLSKEYVLSSILDISDYDEVYDDIINPPKLGDGNLTIEAQHLFMQLTGYGTYHGSEFDDLNKFDLEFILKLAKRVIESNNLSQDSAYELLTPILAGPSKEFFNGQEKAKSNFKVAWLALQYLNKQETDTEHVAREIRKLKSTPPGSNLATVLSRLFHLHLKYFI